MKSRTQYLLFLSFWAGVALVGLFIALAYGFDFGENPVGPLTLLGILALAPAAAGFVAVLKARTLIDRWRVRRGDNVYQKRAYEDDGGYLHLREVPASERQEEVSVREIVTGMKPLLDHATKKSNDSEL